MAALRDEYRERRFLMAAEEKAPLAAFPAQELPEAFADHAARRLQAGESTHGASWTRLDLAAFAREISEEGADVGAWSVLALQALDDAPLSEWAKWEVVKLLELAAQAGAAVHGASRLMAKVIEHG